MSKEEEFFDRAQAEVLSKEEEVEMYEQFRSVMAITTKMKDMIQKIELLENRSWAQN